MNNYGGGGGGVQGDNRASTDFVTANSFVSFLFVSHDYLKT
jgi:hypothetical protein